MVQYDIEYWSARAAIQFPVVFCFDTATAANGSNVIDDDIVNCLTVTRLKSYALARNT